MFDTVSLGELLIDFTPRGLSEQGSYVFEANSGGAPCNVLAAMTQLGKSTAFIGKVGDDTFGHFLCSTLKRLNINTDSLYFSKDSFTTLAFVTIDETGNREFSFNRNKSADVMLAPEEVNSELIKKSRIFHCGTLSLTDSPSREATLRALDIAKENGVLISVDPNLREPLWKNLDDARRSIKLVLGYADIIKISDYELEFLYGIKDIKQSARMLWNEYKPKILFVTCGRDDAYLLKDDIFLHHPCFDVKTIDTTGAGDCFCGAALSCMLNKQLNFAGLDVQACSYILKFASAAASLATTKRGAIASMPDTEDIMKLMNGKM